MEIWKEWLFIYTVRETVMYKNNKGVHIQHTAKIYLTLVIIKRL